MANNNNLTNENYVHMNEWNAMMEENNFNELMEIASDYIAAENGNQGPTLDEVRNILQQILSHPLVQEEREGDPFIDIQIMALQDLENALFMRQQGYANQWGENANRYEGNVFLPTGASNLVSFNNIENGQQMVNFHGERGFGRYYTKNTFNRLQANHTGFKKNPATRQAIQPRNVTSYTAKVGMPTNFRTINTSLFTEGGSKRKKTRKAKKSRKTRQRK